ncbi:hypothetical protein BDA96_03G323400 [Sorghum bicolor]|uniref:TCP domain-containing protein n=2 Tax=Sorghum bicolor TaxID=4558 RepID=A0A921RG18_SORBI|nr:hypothetical protein BDA96_03G323400 [Sorghum bicolor]KXG33398.1 hypothetical protein SORBI_3003G299700 [Sorghum bicolor]
MTQGQCSTGRRGQVSLLKLEEDKNQLSKGLDPWSNPTAATASTLHYLLQEKERAQAQEQLQIYHQQGFSSYLQHHHRRQQQQQQQQQSRAAAAGAGAGADGVSSGESTPVDALATAFGGGRIVRSAAGRKDRHSKVCTARGLRDRRVRLAAHTAIRFYDVQDRLGYDRPSKAVDWLIRNAKAAIDELPADRAEGQPAATEAADATEPAEQVTSTSSYGFGNPSGAIGGVAGSFMPHSVGSADGGVSGSGNVKSLFPSSSTASTTPTQDEYRGSPPDLLSRTTSSHHPQELCLTLQSTNNQQHQIFSHHVSQSHHGMISGAGVQGWSEHGQRMPSWHAAASENSSAGDGRGAAGNGDSYMFGVPPRHQGLDHQGQLFSQGEPLQSSGGWPSARAWLDPLAAIHQPSTIAGQVGGFSHLVGAGAGGFMGFLAPAAAHQRLQGEEEQGSEAMRE